MLNKDVLQRFTIGNGLRGEIIYLNQTFKLITTQHQYPSFIHQALGEILAAAGLFAAIIKFQGRLTIQFQGQGDLKFLLAQCDQDLNLRGMAEWKGETLSEQALQQAFKSGTLAILLDSNDTNMHYQGVVAWKGNSLSESIEGYFVDSEQVPTRVWLTANEEKAVGMLLQAMPAKELNQTDLEHLDNKSIQEVLAQVQISTKELLKVPFKKFIMNTFQVDAINVFPERKVQFKCTCTRERGEAAVLMLGKEEALAELTAKNSLLVKCEFCSTEYTFGRREVEALFEKNSKPPILH